MFKYMMKRQGVNKKSSESEDESAQGKKPEQSELTEKLEDNLLTLKNIITESSDLIIREFVFGNRIKAAIIYIDGLIDKALVNEDILKPLMYINHSYQGELPEVIDINYVKSNVLFVGSIDEKKPVMDIVSKILSGDTAFLMDGASEALIISTRGWQSRSVTEPETEATVRGSREGFTETLRTNTSMLRRKIKNPDLKFETITIGERTKTDVCIAYIEGLADIKLIDEIKNRLLKIKTDAILESGYIEQYIEDNPYSIFSTVGNSEKPDKVAAKLLEGRAAIIVDGTPFVLTVPMVFIESFQSSEDYYSRPYFASMIRLLRFVGHFVSLVAPALYVALSNFHQELIPTPLLLSMVTAHEGVPFPTLVEAGLMMLCFDLLREAGVRLPKPIGQAVSIVGALVIGDAAVSAGLIGAPMVIIVAITAVASFVAPAQTDSGVIIRYALLILAGFMGGYGIAIGLFALLFHMASLRSFGTPYLAPLAPFSGSGMKDTLIRAPLWTMIKRPKFIAVNDDIRQDAGQKPTSSNNNEN